MKSGQVIRVHGFVMLKGLEQGLYKVLSQDAISYTFAKHRGSKAICRHYKTSVDAKVVCFDRGDLNGIEILK
jgi:hypothetical protein